MDWLATLLEFFGGMVLLLFGWERLGGAFQVAFGHIVGGLGRQVDGPWSGIARSALASAFLHSSTVTTIMAVGFVTAGLMGLPQVIWILLGAELGSALAVQLLAFSLWKIGPGVMLAGFLLAVLAKTGTLRQMGHLLVGLGLALLGLHLMAEAAAGLARWPFFWEVLRPLWVFPLAAVLAALSQSIIGVVSLALALATQGLLPVESAAPWILGALSGSCVNAAWSMSGKPPEGRRVGLAHILVRGGTVALGLLFMSQLTTWAHALASPWSREVVTMADPRLLAHLLLLLAGGMALLFLPLVSPLERLCIRLLPNPESDWQAHPNQIGVVEPAYQPKYLDESLLESPSLALGMARREAKEVATLLGGMIADLPEAIARGDMKNMARLRRLDDQVDDIHRAITVYLSRLDTHALSAREMDELLAVVGAVNDFESIGDIIENNLYHLAEVRVENRVAFSQEENARLFALQQAVLQAYRLAVNAFVTDNADIALKVLAMKEEINRQDSACRRALILSMRTGEDSPDLVAFSLLSDMQENLKRIYYHAKRIAKAVIRPGEMNDRMSNDD